MKKKINKDKKKKNRKFNKATRNFIIAFAIIVLGFIFVLYFNPSKKLTNSEKELNIRQNILLEEKKQSEEIKSKLAYLNTPAGIKHIAKLNGFVEPGEVVIQLTDSPTLIIEKPKKNIFGKEIKLACKEHTIKNKPHYNKDCVTCQKINQIYEKSKEK